MATVGLAEECTSVWIPKRLIFRRRFCGMNRHGMCDRAWTGGSLCQCCDNRGVRNLSAQQVVSSGAGLKGLYAGEDGALFISQAFATVLERSPVPTVIVRNRPFK